MRIEELADLSTKKPTANTDCYVLIVTDDDDPSLVKILITPHPRKSMKSFNRFSSRNARIRQNLGIYKYSVAKKVMYALSRGNELKSFFKGKSPEDVAKAFYTEMDSVNLRLSSYNTNTVELRC